MGPAYQMDLPAMGNVTVQMVQMNRTVHQSKFVVVKNTPVEMVPVYRVTSSVMEEMIAVMVQMSKYVVSNLFLFSATDDSTKD